MSSDPASPLALPKVLCRTLWQLRPFLEFPTSVSTDIYLKAKTLRLHYEDELDILALDPSQIVLEASEDVSQLNSYLSVAVSQLMPELIVTSEMSELLWPYLAAREVLTRSDSLPMKNRFLEESKAWKPFSEQDDTRLPMGYSTGGIALTDQEVLAKLRRVGKELIYRIGKKILSGSLNLTTISFPIICMQGNSALHNCLKAAGLCPLYLNKAALTSNHVERMKLTIAATICSFAYTSTFLKPLNPILGETLTAHCEDGTVMYSEQTTHHPPISHVMIVGPNDLYRVHGFYSFESKAGLNSVTINNSGRRKITFLDQEIEHNCPQELFSGTFIGTLHHESLGVLKFSDVGHDLKCELKFAAKRNKPSDYFQGLIEQHGDVVCAVSGTYLGYLDFDDERYWDARYVQPFPLTFQHILPSDSEFRADLVELRSGRNEEAQAAKEALEELQRRDRKLRAQAK